MSPAGRLLAAGAAVTLLLGGTDSGRAAAYTVEVYGGSAVQANSTLKFRLRDRPDFSKSARWETRGFTLPPWYLIRAARRGEDHAWELQFLHHKLHLTNPDDRVTAFEVSHGYNLITVNRAWRTLPVILRFGGGAALAHADNVVDGQSYLADYELTGPVFLGGAAKEFTVWDRLFLGLETQLSYGWVRVPVSGGTAETTNLSLHFMVGAGFVFGGSS